MPIYELGYRHWEGPLRGPLWRWWAITKNGIAIGLRSKLMRRLCFVAWAPLLYFGPLFFALGLVTDPSSETGHIWFEMASDFLGRPLAELLRTRPDIARPLVWSLAFGFFFGWVQLILSLIATAIVAPPQISRDIRSKAFLIYFSKPITRTDYLLGKSGTVLGFLFWITLFPGLLLYVVSVVFSPSLAATLDTAITVPRIVLASLFTAVPLALIGLVLSSFSRDERYPAFVWIAIWIFGDVAYQTVSRSGEELAGSSWIVLLSIRHTIRSAVQQIFAARDQFLAAENLVVLDELPEVPGLEANPSGHLAMVWLAAISVVCIVVLARRVSAPLRI